MSALKSLYKEQLVPGLQKKLSLSNRMQVPKLKKVVLNMGVGRALKDSKALEFAREDLSRIAGQHAVVRKARRSVAAFKVRDGMGVGVAVTLRKERMYDFLERLFLMALPRVRNYRGASLKSFDDQANYSLGIPEHTVFYEVDYNKVPYTMGLDVCIHIDSLHKDHSRALLEGLGLPFRKER